MPVLEPDGDTDAIVTQYEYDSSLEQVTVRGANPELVDPVDLLATQGRLEAVFNSMLKQSREYEHLKATQTLRQQKMERKITNALVAAVEKGTSFEPSSDVLETELYGDEKIPDPESGAQSTTVGEQPEQVEQEIDATTPPEKSVTDPEHGADQ
jgi:hypothetical protein